MTTTEGQEYGIDKILCCRSKKMGRGTKREALVQWTGFLQPTWEPLSEFAETVALDLFEREYGNAATNDGPRQEYNRPKKRKGRVMS